MCLGKALDHVQAYVLLARLSKPFGDINLPAALVTEYGKLLPDAEMAYIVC